MARLVELHPTGLGPQLIRTAARDKRLEEFLQFEITQALSARHPQEEMWREAKRQYAAIPRQPYRNTPVPNAPNIEVPLGAIATDAQYASITDTLYSASPLLTARALDEVWVTHAKAAQRWVNYISVNDVGLREATDHAFMDCCQLGTGVFYIPFIEDIYKHKVYNVRNRGPRIIPIAPENWLTPGGSRGQIQFDQWTGLRFWYQPDEMKLRAKFRTWDMSRTLPVASIDWTRRRTEQLGLTDSASHWREMYEIFDLYMHFDYMGDGEAIDILVSWDRSSMKVLSVEFNPYDNRPIEPMRYQLRPHLAYGIGIMEMCRPFQDEATEIHNHRTLNMLIANSRIWEAVSGQVPESMEVWPNKVIEVQQSGAIKELRMGDVYPSSSQAEMSVTALAERRVGMEGSGAGGGPRSLGTRTPGITALSTMQAQNRRFAPAFDSMRLGAAGAVRQCLMRQRERLMSGDQDVENHMRDVLGDGDAALVTELLRQSDFGRYVAVEFTALSPTVSKEADRQNAQMASQQLTQYYSQTVSLLTQVATAAAQAPGIAQAMLPMVQQIIEKSKEAMDRYLRTFDQFRDPQTFLLDADPAIQSLQQAVQAGQQQQEAQAQQQAMMAQAEGGGGGAGLNGLAQLLGGGASPESNGGPPIDTGQG